MATGEEEDEPLSPTARLMHAPEFNLHIVLFIGYTTKIDPTTYKKSMQQTLLKHPRASCIPVTCKGKWSWRRTVVDIDNHVFVPDVGPAAGESPDEFVAEFATNLLETPMDATKPLWEAHILNVTTADAESVVVMKIHHSMGDGVSLIALVHACSRRISDPDSLPEFPAARKRKERGGGAAARLLSAVWTAVLIVVYTLMDVTAFVATLLFMRDERTPITVGRSEGPRRRQRFVHGIVSLDDVKLIKTAMNVSINDVVLGMTEAGLSRYLNAIYEKKKENGEEIKGKSSKLSLPRNLAVRSSVVFNLRPSPTIENLVEMMEKEKLNGMWGNIIAIVLLPISIDLQEDPLKYIHRAKSTMDRKKLSLAHNCAFFLMKLMMSLFGIKAAALATRAVFRNTTFAFSNVRGTKEEVNLFGHHVSYIAPSVNGFPQSLVVHYLSYGDKLVISIGADEKLIPNPHLLCDDFINSLQIMKEAVIKRGLLDASQLC